MRIIVNERQRKESYSWSPFFTLERDDSRDESVTSVIYMQTKEKKNFLRKFVELEERGEEIPEELVLILNYITNLSSINLHEKKDGKINIDVFYRHPVYDYMSISFTISQNSNVIKFLESL